MHCVYDDCFVVVCIVGDQAEGPGVHDAVAAGILDLYLTKYWAVKFAAAAACTVLRVDQVCYHG